MISQSDVVPVVQSKVLERLFVSRDFPNTWRTQYDSSRFARRCGVKKVNSNLK